MAAREDRIRVLVADDHPVVREGVASMIEGQQDMEVVGEAAGGEEAIALFQSLQPDVMLLDLKLPDMDGVEVILRLRAENSQARIIMLTTFTGDVQARRALTAGAAGYMLKGSLRHDLREAIREVHAGKRYIQAAVAAELAEHTAAGSLTAREMEVLLLISQGCSNRLVGNRLQIKEDTVKSHVISILAKLRANDRTHAVTIALQRGFFEIQGGTQDGLAGRTLPAAVKTGDEPGGFAARRSAIRR